MPSLLGVITARMVVLTTVNNEKTQSNGVGVVVFWLFIKRQVIPYTGEGKNDANFWKLIPQTEKRNWILFKMQVWITFFFLISIRMNLLFLDILFHFKREKQKFRFFQIFIAFINDSFPLSWMQPKTFVLNENINLNGYSVVLPSVCVGNIAQLAVDLLISTLEMKKVATIWHVSTFIHNFQLFSTEPYSKLHVFSRQSFQFLDRVLLNTKPCQIHHHHPIT